MDQCAQNTQAPWMHVCLGDMVMTVTGNLEPMGADMPINRASERNLPYWALRTKRRRQPRHQGLHVAKGRMVPGSRVAQAIKVAGSPRRGWVMGQCGTSILKAASVQGGKATGSQGGSYTKVPRSRGRIDNKVTRERVTEAT
jgi:hypothetical protein